MSDLSHLFYIYLASGIFFLLIEMLTATFYGLAIALSCFCLVIYVFITGDTNMTMIQGVLLAITSWTFAYILPRYIKPHTPELKLWLDVHIGQSFPLEYIGNDWKVKIDGVDYLIGDQSVTDEFIVGKKVVLAWHEGGVLRVTIIK